MSDPQSLSFSQKSILQQGYCDLSPKQVAQLQWGLRFTPTVCSLITLYALANLQVSLLFVTAALGMIAFFFPANHPMDMFYNSVIARIFNAERLPPNPLQRRMACFAAGIMNTASAILILNEQITIAYIVGGMLLSLQAIVIFTHFCTLSWFYELVMKATGQDSKGQSIEEVAYDTDAVLIDVRSAHEYASGHVQGALNFPLEQLETNKDQLPNQQKLLYCASGMRSHRALLQLQKLGITNCINLGKMANAQRFISR